MVQRCCSATRYWQHMHLSGHGTASPCCFTWCCSSAPTTSELRDPISPVCYRVPLEWHLNYQKKCTSNLFHLLPAFPWSALKTKMNTYIHADTHMPPSKTGPRNTTGMKNSWQRCEGTQVSFELPLPEAARGKSRSSRARGERLQVPWPGQPGAARLPLPVPHEADRGPRRAVPARPRPAPQGAEGARPGAAEPLPLVGESRVPPGTGLGRTAAREGGERRRRERGKEAAWRPRAPRRVAPFVPAALPAGKAPGCRPAPPLPRRSPGGSRRRHGPVRAATSALCPVPPRPFSGLSLRLQPWPRRSSSPAAARAMNGSAASGPGPPSRPPNPAQLQRCRCLTAAEQRRLLRAGAPLSPPPPARAPPGSPSSAPATTMHRGRRNGIPARADPAAPSRREGAAARGGEGRDAGALPCPGPAPSGWRPLLPHRRPRGSARSGAGREPGRGGSRAEAGRHRGHGRAGVLRSLSQPGREALEIAQITAAPPSWRLSNQRPRVLHLPRPTYGLRTDGAAQLAVSGPVLPIARRITVCPTGPRHSGCTEWKAGVVNSNSSYPKIPLGVDLQKYNLYCKRMSRKSTMLLFSNFSPSEQIISHRYPFKIIFNTLPVSKQHSDDPGSSRTL